MATAPITHHVRTVWTEVLAVVILSWVCWYTHIHMRTHTLKIKTELNLPYSLGILIYINTHIGTLTHSSTLHSYT